MKFINYCICKASHWEGFIYEDKAKKMKVTDGCTIWDLTYSRQSQLEQVKTVNVAELTESIRNYHPELVVLFEDVEDNPRIYYSNGILLCVRQAKKTGKWGTYKKKSTRGKWSTVRTLQMPWADSFQEASVNLHTYGEKLKLKRGDCSDCADCPDGHCYQYHCDLESLQLGPKETTVFLRTPRCVQYGQGIE